MINKLKGYIRRLNLPEQPNLLKDISGSHNSLNEHSSTFQETTIKVRGENNQIIIDDECKFKNILIYIKGNNNIIEISKNVEFKRGGELWIEDDNCTIKIGENSTFENTHIAVTENNSKIIIGSDCMFAYDIDLRTGDSHSIIDINSSKRINYAKDIIIGNHVWVASHVSILKGSIISNNSIVATRSVVTKIFNQENVLIGGLPAKILKENITWLRERI